MKCKCRTCGKVYESLKSHADWTGFCSAKCLHNKAKELGYSKAKEKLLGVTEYSVLKRAKCIGDVPV